MSRKQKNLRIAAQSMHNPAAYDVQQGAKNRKNAEAQEKEQWDRFVQQIDEYLTSLGVMMQTKEDAKKGWVENASTTWNALRRFLFKYDITTKEYDKDWGKTDVTYRFKFLKKILENYNKDVHLTVEWIKQSVLEYEEIMKPKNDTDKV